MPVKDNDSGFDLKSRKFSMFKDQQSLVEHRSIFEADSKRNSVMTTTQVPPLKAVRLDQTEKNPINISLPAATMTKTMPINDA